MRKIKSKFTISAPQKTLSPRMYLSQCSEWDSQSNQEGGLVQLFSSLGSSGYFSAPWRLGCRHDQFIDHNSIKRNCYFYPFQPFNNMCNGIAGFWGILASQPNSLPRSLCLHNLGNLVVTSLTEVHGATQICYSLNDFLINSNCMVPFSSHNWHALRGRGNYCSCTRGQTWGLEVRCIFSQ